MKICVSCKKEKSPEDFYKDKRNIDGLHSNCKVCHKENVTSWNRAHPEIGVVRASKWNMENKERAKENLKRYREKKKLEKS